MSLAQSEYLLPGGGLVCVSWHQWTGRRADASPCRQLGRAGPYRGEGGAQVSPEIRVPVILQLGEHPWGLPGLCLCRLCALPIRGPSSGGLGPTASAAWLGLGGAPGDTRPISTSDQGAGGPRGVGHGGVRAHGHR